MFLFFFPIKNVLVPGTSHVKGLRLRYVSELNFYLLRTIGHAFWHPVIRQSLQASDNTLETTRYHYDFSLTARTVLTSLTAE